MKKQSRWSIGAGMDVSLRDFPTMARMAMSVMLMMPSAIREKLLFGGSSLDSPLQKMLMRLSGGARLVETRFTEGPMIGDVFECWTCEKYFILGSRAELDAQERLTSLIRSGQTVYDIAGYAGYLTLLCSRLVGAEGHVYTFEPSRINLPRLQRNIYRNDRKNVTIVDLAISDVEGAVYFHEAGSMSSVVAETEPEIAGTPAIKTTRLDDFAYRDKNSLPDLIKIDIEGHAGAAVMGSQQLLADRPPIILVELHDPNEQDQVTAVLRQHGYKFDGLDAGTAFPFRIIALPPTLS
jgi:FkbM family methyltransferase